MQSIVTAYTNKNSYINAVQALEEQLKPVNPDLIIFFASPYYSPNLIAKAMQEKFPTINTIGCTSAGELCNDHVLSHSIVAMGISKAAIGDYSIKIIHDISSTNNTSKVLNEFESYFDTSMLNMSPKDYFGMVLFDGIQEKEEKILATMGALSNITFLGGSASDDELFEKTHLYYNGHAYTDAALVMVCKPNAKFDYIKTQSFDQLDETLTCTKVDQENGRVALEFNDLPASEAYAKLLNLKVEEIEDVFINYPLGQIIDRDPYVRAPLRIKNSGIQFHSKIIEGVTYQLMKSRSVIADTKISIAEKSMVFGEITGLINFNCVLRTRELRKINATHEYGKIFETIPSIGFNTYGETCIGHMNQTSVMLIFGNIE